MRTISTSLLAFASAAFLLAFEASATELVSIPSSSATKAISVTLEQGDAAIQRRRYRLAFNIYNQLAQQGNAQAQLNLGGLYAIGKGVQRNYALAALWYTRAAEQGLALAQVIVAENLERGDRGFPLDPAAAVPWYQKAADQGFVEAQRELGRRYGLGEGVPQDYSVSAGWYKKAADQGDAESQLRLGLIYFNGEGVSQDDVISSSWFLKAAEQGRADAQVLLGMRIFAGLGLPKDSVQGLKWLILGTDDLASLMWLAETAVLSKRQVMANLTPAQISEAQALAKQWRKPTTNRTIR